MLRKYILYYIILILLHGFSNDVFAEETTIPEVDRGGHLLPIPVPTDPFKDFKVPGELLLMEPEELRHMMMNFDAFKDIPVPVPRPKIEPLWYAQQLHECRKVGLKGNGITTSCG